jgi:hypothetical protein
MNYYKLTDQNGRTRNNTQWGPGIRHEATGNGTGLCSDGWIHCYPDKYLAVLRNPCDADFAQPQCWLFEPEGESLIELLKCGFKAGTTVKRVPLPRFTMNQRVVFAILCAKAAPDWKGKDKWNVWADKWLSGEDRTVSAASAAIAAARAAIAASRAANVAARASRAAANVAATAADSAAYIATARAADSAATAADSAAYIAAYIATAGAADSAARAAARAADSAARGDGGTIDFPALALQAYHWKDKK